MLTFCIARDVRLPDLSQWVDREPGRLWDIFHVAVARDQQLLRVDCCRPRLGRLGPLPAQLCRPSLKDLGAGVIRGIECDHLAFRTKEVDWQIWIAQGARPYPCRYVITSKKVTGQPQYTLDIWAWKTSTEVASDGFKLAIPTDAKKLTPDQVPELNDIPTLFTRKGAK
jgi:hypothetical protein